MASAMVVFYKKEVLYFLYFRFFSTIIIYFYTFFFHLIFFLTFDFKVFFPDISVYIYNYLGIIYFVTQMFYVEKLTVLIARI